MTTKRSIQGLRDSMFDVLDELRAGSISIRQARAQMDAAKAICMTVVCERQELEIIQRQIELDERMTTIHERRKVIEHECP